MDNKKWESRFRSEEIHALSIPDQITWLTDILNSDYHRDNTPTTFYGIGDPRTMELFPCICGRTDPAISTKLNSKVKTYRVSCQCNRATPSLSSARKAIIYWNLSNNNYHVNYRTLPFFGLAKLGVNEAKDRLHKILNDLTLRITIANLQRKLNKSISSKGYEERLLAYKDQAEFYLAILNRPIVATSEPVQIVRSSRKDLIA